MAPFLIQLASQGLVVIANGGPEDPAKGGTYQSYGTYGRSSSKSLTDSIDWAFKVAKEPKWAHIDTSRIAAAGQSCGGFEASGIASDLRVSTFAMFNSGLRGTKFTKPSFYFLGGKGDMAASGVRNLPFQRRKQLLTRFRANQVTHLFPRIHRHGWEIGHLQVMAALSMRLMAASTGLQRRTG
jgi:hypothetical protein